MWLNDDYVPCEETPHEDPPCENVTCRNMSYEDDNHEINLTQPSCKGTADTNELLFTLLEVVEKLSEIILEEKPPQTPVIPPPTFQNTTPPPPQMVSTPTLKTKDEWTMVTGKPKPVPKTTCNTIESSNMFDLLAAIPDSPAEYDNVIPASTWSDSPTRPAHTQLKQQKPPLHASKSNRRRPAAVVNKFPERNSTWKTTVPGNSSFSDIVQHGKKVILFSDSICNRFSEWELNKKATNCRIKKKAFPGATASDLAEHHMHPYLKKNVPDVAVIHVGANDIFQLGGKEGRLTDEQIKEVCGNVLTCGMICKEYGTNKVSISSVLPGKSKDFTLSSIFINNALEKLCEEVGFDFIRNVNIIYEKPTEENEGLFYRDGLHLNDDGRQILMQNFIDYLNNHD